MTVRFRLPSRGFIKHVSLYLSSQGRSIRGDFNVLSTQAVQDEFGHGLVTGGWMRRSTAAAGAGGSINWDGDFPLTADLELTTSVRNDSALSVNMKCDIAVWQP